MGVEKRHVARGGKNIIFRRGGGIDIVFGPKYRPLVLTVHISASSVPVHHGIDGAAEGAEPPSYGHGEQRLRGCRGDH
jgi:hypothetical protein